ncbi:RsmE family RNA methyltransferase [Bryobacter aggregatus]|uniref:RsmE family RNA methyltransferase n=1 Tax=Bryobacter aggregatus TaxID=360054 RepID=UPI0004E1960C|nr:RsmE family RNA methyltransferase [Bryobacter aggregatus]
MARRLFFVPQVHSGQAELRGDEAKHLSRVLRVEVGQVFEISDNQQKYLAKVADAHKELVRFEILEKLSAHRELPVIHLYAAIIKFEHFEWGIEKATELGVDRIIPVQTARSEPGLERAVTKRLERWRRIALESSQQCRRAFIPELSEVMRFRDVAAKAEGQRIFLDENRAGLTIGKLAKAEDAISVLIGPEGGWTEDERSLAATQNWVSASLGPRVLRAETAWLATLAILRA